MILILNKGLSPLAQNNFYFFLSLFIKRLMYIYVCFHNWFTRDVFWKSIEGITCGADTEYYSGTYGDFIRFLFEFMLINFLVFGIEFSRPVFVLLPFSLRMLHCLSFELRLVITAMVSCNIYKYRSTVSNTLIIEIGCKIENKHDTNARMVE
jgi:hypothetical protein